MTTDAPATATGMLYRVRLRDERRFGPAAMDDILEWARQGRVPADAVLEPIDGSPERSVLDEPNLARIVGAPPTVSPGTPAPARGPGVIPTKNPAALIGYYFAVFSLVAPFLTPVALILGIMGLVRVRRHPESRGTAHAWFAIVAALVVTAGWVALIVALN
jgi:hypothetical protein